MVIRENRSVYVMWRQDGAHKIGYSTAPPQRLATLQYQSKQTMRLVYAVERPRGDAHEIEAAVHWQLNEHALGAEWFAVSESQAIETIQSVCERADVQAEQHARIEAIEKLEKKARRRFTRHEVIRLELDGAFGQQWADVRRQQGWEERLANSGAMNNG